MIFRVTWTNTIGVPSRKVQWFCEADTKKEALQRGRHEQLAKQDVEAQEWTHCMAPQHAAIPSVHNFSAHLRQIEMAVKVHEGTPYCATCMGHKLSDLANRVERLDRAFCDLLDSFDRHMEDHP
jgi:hypothetical protein